MKKLLVFLIIVNLMLTEEIAAQKPVMDYLIKYQYSITDTPYGDYFGWINLKRDGRSYRGEIIDEDGKIYNLKVTRADGKSLNFRLQFDGAKLFFKCELFGDSIRGVGKSSGEKFKFLMKGKKVNY
jgi:hypothetical protein